MRLKFCKILFSKTDFGVFDTLRSSTALSQSIRSHNTATTDPEPTLATMLSDHLCDPLREGKFFVYGLSIIRSGLGLIGCRFWALKVCGVFS